MKYAIPFLFVAGPALAHEGAHVHAHGVEAGALALILLGVATLAGPVVMRARARRK